MYHHHVNENPGFCNQRREFSPARFVLQKADFLTVVHQVLNRLLHVQDKDFMQGKVEEQPDEIRDNYTGPMHFPTQIPTKIRQKLILTKVSSMKTKEVSSNLLSLKPCHASKIR